MRKLLRYYIRYNTLSMQIFFNFWIAFALLISLIIIIPQFSSRIVSEVKGSDLRNYQQYLNDALRENQIMRLLIYKDRFTTSESIPTIHPILLNTITKKMYGATLSETNAIYEFAAQSNNTNKPLERTFADINIKVAGPFPLHIHSAELQGKEEPYVVYFAQAENPELQFMNKLLDQPWLLFFIMMLLSTPMLWLLAWSIGRPIRALHNAANQLAQGNFQTMPELEQKGVREFRLVGRSFNQMILTLKGLFETRRMLLSSISHELRTPLTRLHLTAALLRRRSGETAETKRMEVEIDRLNRMIDDILKLGRNQLNIFMQHDVFPITDLWEAVISDVAFEVEHHHLEFEHHLQITMPEMFNIYGNKQALASALENVLRNALKYTRSRIVATAYLRGVKICIVIDDNGDGVQGEEYEKIFQPFYRVNDDRTRTITGTGLGLAIVKSNIEQHGGKVYAEKSPIGGLRMVLEIPLYTGGGNG